MKYDLGLAMHENQKAWKAFRIAHKKECYNNVLAADRERLRAFNERLKRLEEKFDPILKAKLDELQARKENPGDWMQDFNLDYVITFYLREDDPDFDENDDNVLWQIETIYFEDEAPSRKLGNTEIDHKEDHPWFEGEIHCYLYHELYDHTPLDWRDLLRIGDIWVDLKIEEQAGMIS